MHPKEYNQNSNSTYGRTIRSIGFAFAGLAFVLVAVCTISFITARQVQQNYTSVVLSALNKLQLVNELHNNDDEVQNLVATYISLEDSSLKEEIRRRIRVAHDENTAAINQLDKLLQDQEGKELLRSIIRERNTYYIVSDSLLNLSIESPEVARAYARTSLHPIHQRHQQYLLALSKKIKETADIRADEAVASINSSVDKYTLLLLLALASAAGAGYIMRFVFKKLKQENEYLNAEIEERKKLEYALGEQQREYKMLFNRNPIPMWIYNQKTYCILEVNQAAEQEYGYSEAEFLNMTVLDLRPEEDIDRFSDSLKKAAKTKNDLSAKSVHKRKDGSVFQVEVRSHSLPLKAELQPRLVVAVNIQEREQALEQLKRNEEQLREVSSSVPGAVFQYQMEQDGSFCFPYISEGVLGLCGVTPEEVYREPMLLYKNLHPDDLTGVKHTTTASYNNLTPWEQELRVWQPESKKYMWVRGHSLPSCRGKGTVVWNGTFIDITKQKETEEQLKRNEANLRALLDSSSQAIYLLDEELKVISFNREAAADVWKYLLKKLEPGQSMLEYISSTKVNSTRKCHARAMQGETIVFEAGHGEFWHEITYQPVTSDENQTLAVALTIRDISEQKISIETIRRNELQLARAQQLAKLGSWEYHVRQGMLTWSEGTFAVYRKTKDSFVPSLHNMLALIHPEDRDKVKANYLRAIETKSKLNFEHRILLPGGKEANVMEVAEVTCDEAGEVIKLSGTVQDITERKKAEQQVTEAKNLLQTTIENIPEIIFTLNPGLSIIYISPQCKQITGYTEEAFLGKPETWLKVIHPEDQKPLMQEVLPLILSGEPQEYEMRLVDSSGKLRWLLLRMSPGLDQEGKVMQVYGSASDMTAYKEAEAKQQELSDQLIKQNQNLQQFAYIVSHNLRAPIANMLGLTSIYDRNRFDAPINQKVIDNLLKSAQLLDATIHDLNDILTIRSQISSIKETIAFDCLLQTVLEILDAEITACGASVSTDFRDAPEVSSIRSYAQSILLNLVSNAIKYRFPGRKLAIRINTFRVNNYICLRVQDNGSGIDLEKQQDKIFGLYKRFHQGVEGKGLGLHLVKTQVELLGGKVEVHSTLHEGSTFSVYFKS
ncbi:PAS domain S-box protein [Pontibacter pamirensis]|uniref:PAS domain S-box protein n=1 Tax=Pontibacter pamirensis TaxID=2562824 RepID=UPI001389A9B9|nr:PAS domain S-box protein [Pontibacter pamirensis]